MAIYVCDELMGSGKTSAAITMMNEASGERFMFVTPFLEEVNRIVEKCDKQKFYAPQHMGHGKLKSLNYLLKRRKNIATTHALFHTFGPETIELIHQGGYTLILDEVTDVVEIQDISQADTRMLKSTGHISVEPSNRVQWENNSYNGVFGTFKSKVQTGNVTEYNNASFLWTFPIDVFRAFKNAFVLTYMFDAQVLKCYFDMHKAETNMINVVCCNGAYRFTDDPNVHIHSGIAGKVHILQDEKLNSIGNDRTALSVSWYQRSKEQETNDLSVLKNNLYNVFRNRYKCKSNRALWTTFQDYRGELKGKGYTKSFLSCNARSTNAFREHDCLAYCVNVFYNPMLKRYFASNGAHVKENEYALSEMVQWIWRSAIRDGKDIWVYVPSSRMRGLLEAWLLSLQ